jgi:hypothetical protein
MMIVECRNDEQTLAALARARREGRRVLRMARGRTNASWTLAIEERHGQLGSWESVGTLPNPSIPVGRARGEVFV